MTDPQPTIPAPTSAREAQALIDSLREEFSLGFGIPDVDVQQGVEEFLATQSWIPKETSEFMRRNQTGVLEAMEDEKVTAVEQSEERIADVLKWMTAHNIVDSVLECFMDSGWCAEVAAAYDDLEDADGNLVPVVVDASAMFKSLAEAERWARDTAKKVAQSTRPEIEISAWIVYPADEGLNAEDLRIPLTLTSEDLGR